MKQYDFDRVINREGTWCYKYCELDHVFGRHDLLPLWIADMDFAVCPEITQALVDRFANHPIYGYTKPTDGYVNAIIDWQRKRNNFIFTREEAQFVGGIVTGFALVLNFFTGKGDKVVIQEPVYHPFRNVATANGRVVINNALVPTDDGLFRMNLEELEQIFRDEQPRLMVVCNPHNPVGIAWPAESLAEVARLARKYNVVVFSDEIHADLMLYGNRHHVMATVSDDAAAVTITCGAPSKTFNIAGLKSSWCVIKNPALREPFFTWLENNELCCPHLAAMVATEAAYRCGEEWLRQCVEYIEGNIDFVAEYCREHIPCIRAVKPQASFLVWLDCTGLGRCHEDVIDLMVNHAHLGMNDGKMFGVAGQCHMRLNVGVPRSVLVTAMERMAKAVRELK